MADLAGPAIKFALSRKAVVFLPSLKPVKKWNRIFADFIEYAMWCSDIVAAGHIKTFCIGTREHNIGSLEFVAASSPQCLNLYASLTLYVWVAQKILFNFVFCPIFVKERE